MLEELKGEPDDIMLQPKTHINIVAFLVMPTSLARHHGEIDTNEEEEQ